jgi:hypothetical protein
MTVDIRKWQSRGLISAIALLLLTATVMAAPGKSGQYNPNDQTVDMFAAIEKGDIAVQLSFKDSTEGRMRIENKTDKPLNVKLPDAFAGLPVLAQRNNGGGGNGRNGGGGGNRGGGGSQGMGGGGGMGMGGMGGGMGMMNVPPEKVGQMDFVAVCLEHGKHEPRPNIPYEIKPLESFTTTPAMPTAPANPISAPPRFRPACRSQPPPSEPLRNGRSRTTARPLRWATPRASNRAQRHADRSYAGTAASSCAATSTRNRRSS